MPYAAENQISQAPIEGGIEITGQQYQEALAGMMAGKLVSIEGGFAVIDPPEPAQPEPESQEPKPIRIVTRRQGRLALLEVGKLDDVEAAIEAIADPIEKRAAQIEYEADTWERGNAFLQAMWAQLGGTGSELDDLFALAATK